jgi:pimeloyl-ACP methyl ester carboxylesterase
MLRVQIRRAALRVALIAAVLSACCIGTALSNGLSAIFQDPPINLKYPASGAGVQFLSHGKLINAQLYRPAGAGVHPTVILMHGLPGNEQNLDLARAIQRAGWTVITFHYRGSWGSAGTFTLRGGVEDADALVRRLQNVSAARAWGADGARIVIAGHSYGGYVAARIAASHPNLIGVALIAPWDISYDARVWSTLSKEQLDIMAPQAFDDVDGRLTAANPKSLAREVERYGPALNLTALSAQLVGRPLLVVTATRDDPDDEAIGLIAALKRGRGTHFESKSLVTDHGFNDHRIALEVTVLNWLARLPGAP